MCTLPFSVDINVFRLITEDSYEQKMYQRQQRQQKVQSAIFGSRNIFHRHMGLIEQSQLNFPVNVNTTEEKLG